MAEATAARVMSSVAALFDIAWHTHGHPQVIATEEGLEGFDAPAVLQCPIKNATVQASELAWRQYFTKKGGAHPRAEMTKGHGNELVKNSFAAVAAKIVLADLGKMIMWGGDAPNTEETTFQTNFAGEMRHLFHGEVSRSESAFVLTEEFRVSSRVDSAADLACCINAFRVVWIARRVFGPRAMRCAHHAASQVLPHLLAR